MRLRRALFATLLCVVTAGCVSVQYDPHTSAYFTGSVLVIWIGEGGASGDGKFLFVPNPNDRLTLHRDAGNGAAAVIEPGLMYTDGGSIPRIAQVFNGLSPWGYAPAYMIHDWIFTARHCLVDGQDSPKYDQVRNVGFDESATILNEAISALINHRKVKRNDLAIATITAAVDSVVARRLWDEKGGCAALQVTPEDLAAAQKVVPGASAFRRLARAPAGNELSRELQAAVEATRGVRLPPARLVAEVSFER